jgi:polyhydroxybutyrate depolymerase
MRRTVCLLTGLVALAACADSSSTPDTPRSAAMVASDATRPFTLYTPSSYRDDTPMPLVILLHGLGRSGELVETYFELQPLAESQGFLYVHPDGTAHPAGDQFWDATDACCGFGSTADDVTYLTSIIDQVGDTRNVDSSRVHVMGHSNGGFMSYRMACDAAERVAAIASVAGATWVDTSRCNPSEPVSVLQVHGTADVAIEYDGGGTPPDSGGAYPGAATSVATWAEYDGCDAESVTTAGTLDLDSSLPGEETVVTRVDGCPNGVGVELWTLQGGSHNPDIRFPDGSRPLSEGIIEWLFAHPKP